MLFLPMCKDRAACLLIDKGAEGENRKATRSESKWPDNQEVSVQPSAVSHQQDKKNNASQDVRPAT